VPRECSEGQRPRPPAGALVVPSAAVRGRGVSEHCGSRSTSAMASGPSATPMGVSASSLPTQRAAALSNRGPSYVALSRTDTDRRIDCSTASVQGRQTGSACPSSKSHFGAACPSRRCWSSCSRNRPHGPRGVPRSDRTPRPSRPPRPSKPLWQHESQHADVRGIAIQADHSWRNRSLRWSRRWRRRGAVRRLEPPIRQPAQHTRRNGSRPHDRTAGGERRTRAGGDRRSRPRRAPRGAKRQPGWTRRLCWSGSAQAPRSRRRSGCEWS
jgi:hypothetical protein